MFKSYYSCNSSVFMTICSFFVHKFSSERYCLGIYFTNIWLQSHKITQISYENICWIVDKYSCGRVATTLENWSRKLSCIVFIKFNTRSKVSENIKLKGTGWKHCNIKYKYKYPNINGYYILDCLTMHK